MMIISIISAIIASKARVLLAKGLRNTQYLWQIESVVFKNPRFIYLSVQYYG